MTKSTVPNGGDLTPGTLVNSRYRVIDVVGRGGLATVYRAEDESLKRTVALKVISGSLGDADDARRQQDEVRLIASFHHPGLVTLFDFVPVDDGPSAMLVMQFIDGHDLASRIRRGALPTHLTAAIGASVASALAAVHAGGVIHRDVKPANILLPTANAGASGVAVLADFGIARLVDDAGVTATGTIVGTASYLSPEQAKGAALGPATDVYSLGLVLLECLTGTQAFQGSAVESAVARLSSDPEIPASIDHEFASLLRAMLARDPAARPAASEVEAHLRAISGDGTNPTLVLPSQGTAATERLTRAATTAAVPPAAAAPASAAQGRARGAAIGVGVFAGMVVVALLILVLLLQFVLPALTPTSSPSPSVTPSASPSVTASPTAEPPDYPAVDGPLGDRLADLQASVASLDSDEAERELQRRVLTITELAASEDFEAARAQLDALEDALDDVEVTFAEGATIVDAIDRVRQELDTAIDEKSRPGHSGDKPGKNK